MQSPWEGARHGIPSRGEGLGVVRSTHAEGQLTARADTEFGTGKLEKSHGIASSFSRNYCRVGLVVIRMEEGHYCVV